MSPRPTDASAAARVRTTYPRYSDPFALRGRAPRPSPLNAQRSTYSPVSHSPHNLSRDPSPHMLALPKRPKVPVAWPQHESLSVDLVRMRLRHPESSDADLMIEACRTGSMRDIQALLEARVSVEVRSYNGQTPLMLAVTAQDAELVQVLLSARACVNACDDAGTTALHLAAALGDLKCLKLLCDEPTIDLHQTLRTEDGFTAQKLAQFAQMHDAAAFLAERAQGGDARGQAAIA